MEKLPDPFSMSEIMGKVEERTPYVVVAFQVITGPPERMRQGGSDYVLSSQTEKLMAGTKFSDYLGLNHYKRAKKLKHFIHLDFTYRPQSFGS